MPGEEGRRMLQVVLETETPRRPEQVPDGAGVERRFPAATRFDQVSRTAVSTRVSGPFP